MPLYLIPGNHDERGALRAAFPQHHYLRHRDEFIQYTAAGRTAAAGGPGHACCPVKPEGCCVASRLRWLEEQLTVYRQRPVVILMHHPPFVTGITVHGPGGVADGVSARADHPPPFQRRTNPVRPPASHDHRAFWRDGRGHLPQPGAPGRPRLVSRISQPMFVMEPPGYMLHRWSDERFVTFGVAVGEFDGPYPFYEPGKLIDGAGEGKSRRRVRPDASAAGLPGAPAADESESARRQTARRLSPAGGSLWTARAQCSAAVRRCDVTRRTGRS